MSYKEIADMLGLTQQIVSQKLYRARKKLLQRFQQKWVNLDE
ncbi:sigma factor-like helix-turn-helix DNA-binding protein [Paenibacillus cisolokensis]